MLRTVTAVSTASANAADSKEHASTNAGRLRTKRGRAVSSPRQSASSGAARRRRSRRRRRSASDRECPASAEASAMGTIQASAAVVRATSASPGARAASASAAASSQEAGSVTQRCGASASAPARACRKRTPCHAGRGLECFRMHGIVGRCGQPGKGIWWSAPPKTTKFCGQTSAAEGGLLVGRCSPRAILAGMPSRLVRVDGGNCASCRPVRRSLPLLIPPTCARARIPR